LACRRGRPVAALPGPGDGRKVIGVDVATVLTDSFSRIGEEVHAAVEGLSAEQLAYRVDAEANSIGWLVWHLTRVQDDHVAGVAGTEQVWTKQGWVERFGLPFPTHAIGYGHTSEDVAAVRVHSPDLLTGYYDDVAARSAEYVGGLTDADLDRVVDEAWDPPVTLGVRLVSVIGDDLQHAGQAAFVRGVLLRR
jgi:uncharacterized damage-inducible protein DinB